MAGEFKRSLHAICNTFGEDLAISDTMMHQGRRNGRWARWAEPDYISRHQKPAGVKVPFQSGLGHMIFCLNCVRVRNLELWVLCFEVHDS